MNGFSPVKQKCVYWREMVNPDDTYVTSIKAPDKRVECSCFVEGHVWTFTKSTVPGDCPNYRQCRYYIKST